MYYIEMSIENGSWESSVVTWKGKTWTRYIWKTSTERWVALGGRYGSVDDAYDAIDQFRLCGSVNKPKRFRVRGE